MQLYNWVFQTLCIFLGLLLIGCQTQKGPTQTEAPVAEKAELSPYMEDLTGTTWILRHKSVSADPSDPGYKGFYLARDGRLFLINMDNATGDRWSFEKDTLSLQFLDGTADLPINGRFKVYEVKTENPAKTLISLKIANQAEPQLILEKASPQVDLTENHWVPGYFPHAPAVGWPPGQEIYFIILPDAKGGFSIQGNGGTNRFTSLLKFDQENWWLGAVAITRRTGPMIDFERLYLERLEASNRYVQVDKDLFLYNDTKPLAVFRVQLFN